MAHQQAGTAGVVEVHMGGDDVVHGVACQAQGGQGFEQARHGEIGAGVDEGGAAGVDQQVGGVEARAAETGVDLVDAVPEGLGVLGKNARLVVHALNHSRWPSCRF